VSGAGRPAPGRTGAQAEAAALRWLEARGLRVVALNYRCRAGELDIVALDGPTLAIVEVRYRERAGLVDPAVTVTAAKRRRLLVAAARFLQDHPALREHAVRFDVMALTGPLAAPRCDWIRGAFDASDGPFARR
jgi:putative endonuclease